MKVPFWMSPIVITVGWILFILASYQVDETMYRSLMRTPKNISWDSTLSAILMTALFGFGAFVALLTSRKRPKAETALCENLEFLANQQVLKLVIFIYILTMFAYLLAFGSTFSFSVLQRFFLGIPTKDRLGLSISGITTMTQFGIFVISYSALLLFSPISLSIQVRRILKVMLCSLILFSSYRGLLWSERLGLIELIVPVAILFASFRVRSSLRLAIAPFIGAVFVIALFGAFEYFRSWNYYQHYFDNIVQFSALRFMSYYLSSLNNFAFLTEYFEPYWQPMTSLAFIYKLPIPGNPLVEIFNARFSTDLVNGLERYSHPEFNLFGAVGFIYLDFGVLGGGLVLSVFGYISGKLYCSYCRHAVLGLLVYPIWMIGMLDFGRILYWPSSRAFPVWVCIFLILTVRARLILKGERKS
ncbi:O-antigen polymerase [Thalassobium sp. R2A62]|uniref:O-antigen polymerase n=1 Tax=Thalassobium sp. R2A62 TaxID=633131 RepID=UPI0001B1D5D4|nr:O-antigen polymerase [Thalassobium sp. R2A62]EET49569.1 membrane protein, putative [Thalassobium sp. R2A62]